MFGTFGRIRTPNQQFLKLSALPISVRRHKLLAQTWDSYPSVSQLGNKLAQYTLQRRWRCQHRLLLTFRAITPTNVVRGKGIEPLTKRWQRHILPLN